ncbi:glycoside hydrolase family 38 C-terminal domain-containing protein [Thermosediminibacter oceani]|uniref:Alpha-mannosidase n=1 Tax=Thermosediminibacter oceani (strain ATCC BAA-1034 / DSM 16646 / JW/IW-1228P) TaxID=555079 RepID=D9S1N6_THEOJ|nr:glycoside hydrolase family 38 C-terminal domain-containing protein [Thermosediminibacter oceani]ADL07313.1 Alpha-mannosidase [Thermosediminibacter oceani DSM 16646]
MNLYVVCHTHWDREWHKTFHEYRVKLVEFMDDLIDLLERDENYTSFLLDGQTVVLEDYLDVKPYMKERIRRLVKAGRLVIGPWYVQPDEFLVSGESLIRNLLIGHEIGKDFGRVMKVGYLPDSFGQAACIPQLLKGFGIDSAVFWRGVTDEDLDKTEFLWESPDGSRVFAVHLPLGYGNGASLSKNMAMSFETVEENLKKLASKAATNNILLMCGFDQRFADHDIPEIIKELNSYYKENGKDIRLIQCSIEDYIEKVKSEEPSLKVLKGEFRKGKSMRVHVSIGGTRLDIKRDNFNTQLLYERYLEPISTMAYILGHKYDNDIINRGWKYIIQNHAHDSICTVCTDDTHREMKIRFEFAKQIGHTLLNEKISEISGDIAYKKEMGKPLIVFNTLMRKRKEPVEATIYLDTEEFSLTDNEGRKIPYQIMSVKDVNLAEKEIEIGVKNPDRWVKEIKLVFIAELDGFGYRTYYVKEHAKSNRYTGFIGAGNILENEFYRVSVEDDGSLCITDKETAKTYRGLNIFEESGNAGDEYDFSPPKEDVVITTRGSRPEIALVENGPLFARIRISHILNVPMDTDSMKRAEKTCPCPVDCFVTLYRGIKRVDIKTVIDNRAKNHRIRVLFDGNVEAHTHIAEQQFGVLKRDNFLKEQECWDKEGWEERYYPVYPQRSFVDVSDGQYGLAILNKGLPQYEILNKDKPIIALTLLSGTDYMGKNDLRYRPGRRSGLHIAVPDSQLLGVHEVEYSIVPHKGDYIAGDIIESAHSYITPLLSFMPLNETQGELNDELYFIKTENKGIIESSIKKSEHGPAVVLRIYNGTDLPLRNIVLKLDDRFNAVDILDLKEEKIKNNNKVSFVENKINIPLLNENEIISLSLGR